MLQRDSVTRKATYKSTRKPGSDLAVDNFPDFQWEHYKEEKFDDPFQYSAQRYLDVPDRNLKINPKHQKYLTSTSSKSIPHEEFSKFGFGSGRTQKSLFLELHLKFRDDIMKFVHE